MCSLIGRRARSWRTIFLGNACAARPSKNQRGREREHDRQFQFQFGCVTQKEMNHGRALCFSHMRMAT